MAAALISLLSEELSKQGMIICCEQILMKTFHFYTKDLLIFAH